MGILTFTKDIGFKRSNKIWWYCQ